MPGLFFSFSNSYIKLILTLPFPAASIGLFTTTCSYVYFVLGIVHCYSLIGGVPRTEPRARFALLPLGICPIKFSKNKKREFVNSKVIIVIYVLSIVVFAILPLGICPLRFTKKKEKGKLL